MQVDLTPEQTDVVRHAIAKGRLRDQAQAVQEAMSLWIDRERSRLEMLASLDAASESVARGEGLPITPDGMTALVEDIIERCGVRLGAERASKG